MKSAALTRSTRRKLIAVAIFALALAAPVAANAFTCPTVTTVGAAGNCGIVISAPGCYQITTAQTATSDTSDCVQVAASKVVLLVPTTITGTGASNTADGIHVLASTPGGGADGAMAGGSPITNVTIVGAASIAFFNIGVQSDANDVRIDGETASSNNTDGILLNNVKANRISGVTAIANTDSGVAINSSSANLVSNCNLSDDGNGVSLTNSNGNTISGSTLNGSFGNGAFLQASNGNKFTGNTANGNGEDGFQIFGSSANTLSANTANLDVVGILIDGSPATEVSANTLQSNGFGGIELGGNVTGSHLDSNFILGAIRGSGIDVLAGATGLMIAGNNSNGNHPFDLEDDNPGCASNLWIGDTFTNANQTCIH